MTSHRRVHQTLTLYHVLQATRSLLLLSLLYVLLLSSARTSAQIACGTTHTTRFQVDNSTGTALLRAALNCTGGGQLEANWTGRVSVGAPITVLEGTFLSVTGENAEAEVYGGDTQTRLFEVSQGGGLVLSRLKLSGGSASGGGAIYSKSAGLALDNCVFDGNAATEGNGGAVWADGGNVTIVGGEFLDNSATRYGGAVHSVDGNLVVRGGSRFEGNTAIGGGALFCGLSNVGSDKQAAACSIAEAEFMSNSAARDIQAENYKEEELDVVGFSYLDGGGAAMFLFASVDITDSVFSGNYALLSGGALHGGIDTSILVNGCTFGNNTSGKYAGAISASSMTLGGGTQVTQNSALDDGGAVSDIRSVLPMYVSTGTGETSTKQQHQNRHQQQAAVAQQQQ